MRHILIVDDDEVFKKTMHSALDPNIYSVEFASNGQEALDIMASKKPDAILLDIMMPQMTGMQFLEELQKKSGKNAIPVLITSNLSSLQAIEKGVELGIKGYIVKSNESLENIVSAIDRLFK